MWFAHDGVVRGLPALDRRGRDWVGAAFAVPLPDGGMAVALEQEEHYPHAGVVRLAPNGTVAIRMDRDASGIALAADGRVATLLRSNVFILDAPRVVVIDETGARSAQTHDLRGATPCRQSHSAADRWWLESHDVFRVEGVGHYPLSGWRPLVVGYEVGDHGACIREFRVRTVSNVGESFALRARPDGHLRGQIGRHEVDCVPGRADAN